MSKENGLQKEAFEFYYNLGKQRSLKAVAIQFKRSERTIAGWSSKYSWMDRVAQKDIDEAEGQEKQGLVLDVKVRYRQLFNSLITVFEKDFKAGKIKIKSIQDLERVVKLDLSMLEGAFDKVEGDGELTDEDRAVLDGILNALQHEVPKK